MDSAKLSDDMIYSTIDKETVGDLTGATLMLAVGKDALGAIISRQGIDLAPVRAILPWDNTIKEPTRRIEETIYSNPALLADFNRVHVLIDTPEFCILPDAATEDEAFLQDVLLPRIIPDGDSRTEWVLTPWTPMKAVCAMKESAPLLSFLARTFNNPAVEHRLSPWVRRLWQSDPLGMSGKMFVHITASRLDVVVFGRRTVKLVNSWEYRDLADALYFIMAVRHVLDMDNSSGEILMSGDKTVIEEILPTLREYVASVLPMYADTPHSSPQFEESFHELTFLYLCE